LGGTALGSLTEFLKQTRLKEHHGQSANTLEMVKNLLASHEAIIQSLRVDLESCADTFHDVGTSDFLTGLMEQHEKMAWMLRALVTKD
jgi:starvation-inducible DNA-binding protein